MRRRSRREQLCHGGDDVAGCIRYIGCETSVSPSAQWCQKPRWGRSLAYIETGKKVVYEAVTDLSGVPPFFQDVCGAIEEFGCKSVSKLRDQCA